MAEETMSTNFIHSIIEEELEPGGRCAGKQVHTRFPPEPNGYLHIGHCKALTIDFGTAEKYHGICNLRMDDTNPAKEDTEYVDAIQEDIHWLGFDWGDRFYYGSDYFEQTYELAEDLIQRGLAYVCELTPEQFRAYRGDTTTPAQSPWRDRPVEESLELFRRMKAGEFPEGKYTLRAKIDLASGNLICGTRCSTESAILSTIGRGQNGVFSPCMTLPTPFKMPWRGLRTLCVRWSMKITVPFTTG